MSVNNPVDHSRDVPAEVPKAGRTLRRLLIRLALFATLAVFFFLLLDLFMPRVQVGDQAPDFAFQTASGEQKKLSDFRGEKIVVLYFYPRDNTSICTAQACSFRDAYEQFTDLGAIVIGVSSDSGERHEGFAQKHRLPFLLASDSGGKIRKSFGVPKTFGFLPGRVTYVIDQQGVVRHVFDSQWQADAHVPEALKIIHQLNAQKPPDQPKA